MCFIFEEGLLSKGRLGLRFVGGWGAVTFLYIFGILKYWCPLSLLITTEDQMIQKWKIRTYLTEFPPPPLKTALSCLQCKSEKDEHFDLTLRCYCVTINQMGDQITMITAVMACCLVILHLIVFSLLIA